MNTNRLLAAVLVLQVITLAGQWGGKPAYVSDARADVPNPAERQIAMTEELKSVNQKLERLIGVLEGGRLKVEVTNLGDAKNGKK
jgi:hypothetical protein